MSDISNELAQLYPKLLQMRNILQFGVQSNQIYAERTDNGKRYSLNSWQNSLLLAMDGDRPFGNLIGEVEEEVGKTIAPDALVAFYKWVTEEGIVRIVPQPILDGLGESIFELVDEGEDSEPDTFTSETESKFSVSNIWKKVKRAGKPTGYALIALGLIRLAWVVTPVFQPVGERISYEVSNIFSKPATSELVSVTANRNAQETKIESIQVSGNGLIEQLRQEMAGCRIRRDEYYLQTNEMGYRAEVEKMTALARRIGELELAAEGNTAE